MSGSVVHYDPTFLSSEISHHNFLRPPTLTASLPHSVSNMNPSAYPQPTNTGTGHKNSFNVTNSYNTTYVDGDAQILEWLSPLEPRLRHQDVRTRRLDGLGGWFLQKDDFINWCDSEDGSGMATLFCSGAPGAGKTYLTYGGTILRV